ncbi:hypothetical protein Y1Q_0006475 [Alligator mississippiensis]|uniref:Uncharacterized protein n=1 Tax=Alligator mississippiensis TaxID=8496 RepID=A0A151MVB9_ALLMI|nr:hypothetical protein Y1Q_0006475 [Alligator mississippiensis]
MAIIFKGQKAAEKKRGAVHTWAVRAAQKRSQATQSCTAAANQAPCRRITTEVLGGPRTPGSLYRAME